LYEAQICGGKFMNETPAQGRAKVAKGIRAPVGLFRFSMAQFLIALVVLLVATPFIIALEHGQLIDDILMMIILVSAVLAVGGRSRATILLAIPAMAGPWLDHYCHDAVPFWIISGVQMVFVGFVSAQLLRFILRSTVVNSEVLCAGISAYLMLGLLWTAAFRMVSEYDPSSFSGAHLVANQPLDRFDALYLSFVSLTCLGCNDIAPTSKAARMLLMVESTTGVLFVAVLIARLVALYTQSVAKDSEKPTNG
jgi:hypothetical protein